MDKDNPWLALPDEPDYVLRDDLPYVNQFNSEQQHKPEYMLDLSLVPQPFLGNRKDAPLVVLRRNPNLKGGHKDGCVADAIRANMGPDPRQHRLIGLLPKFDGTENARWWREKCYELILAANVAGVSSEELATRILAVELHGYHSAKAKTPRKEFPSQRYGFWLVKQAIDRGSTIVAASGRTQWERGVPQLKRYEHLVTVSSPQAGTISRGNCVGDGFDRAVEAVTCATEQP